MAPRRLPPASMLGSLALTCILAAVPITGAAGPSDPPAEESTRAGSEGAATALAVTWSDVVARVDAHPRIAAGLHRIAASRASVDAVGAVPNPTVGVTAGYGRARDGSASAVEWGIGLTIPLGWVAQRGAKIQAADAEAKVTLAESRQLRRDVLQALRVLFWNLVYEQERVAALGELGARTAELATIVGRRVDKGANRPVEAIRMEVEAEKIAGELSAAELTLAARQAQLGAWLGVSPDRPVKAVADLASLPEPPSEAQARERVQTDHPAVAAARARVQTLAALVQVERRARVPSASLEAFTDHELDRRAYGLGLSLDLPVWNWNTGGIQQAEAALAASREQLRAERLELETATIEARAACRAGIALATRYKDQVLPRAASVAQTIEKTYELGEATLLEVVDARRTLLDTRRQYLSTLVQAHTDCSRLAAIVGEE